MSSTRASWWRRLWHHTPLYKLGPCGNYHWYEDRYCECRVNEHCGDWEGWIYDFKTQRPKFPQQEKEYWYSGSWYLYLADLQEKGRSIKTLDVDIREPARNKIAFNPYHMGIYSGDKIGLIDGLIPAIRIGKYIGLYKLVGGRYGQGAFYDGASWDDGYKIDLEFVRSIVA